MKKRRGGCECYLAKLIEEKRGKLTLSTSYFVLLSIQFCLFHNHLNVFIYRLGVDRFAAWEMIRNTREAFFERRSHLENSARLKA